MPLFSSKPSPKPTEQTKRPDVVIFLSDQQRWDSCGCYGQRLPVTPTLDAFAQEGVRYEHCFTCQPVCGPARASIQTGVYATQIGCHVNNRSLPIDADTMAKRMRAAGYHCGYVGKWHLASSGPKHGPTDFGHKGVPQEFRGGWDDFWLAADLLEAVSDGYAGGKVWDGNRNERSWEAESYRVDAMTNMALECLDAAPIDKPAFTFISYLEPHHQNNLHEFQGPRGSKEMWKDYDVPGDLVGTKGDWEKEMPDYLGCCHAVDAAFAKVLEKLRKRGTLENTLVIYTSDHGCHFRTRNSEYKRSCHDNSIRIPLVLRGPGFLGGKVCEHIASNLDLPSTVLRAATLEVPSHFHGVPLQDVLSGECVRSEFLVQISEDHCGRALRTPRWTYAVRAAGCPWTWAAMVPASEVYHQAYLYDNEKDPHQRDNLVSNTEFANIRTDMCKRLLASIKAIEDMEPRIEEAPPGYLYDIIASPNCVVPCAVL